MTKPMTPERLKEIKARCEAATEGPWLRHENAEYMFTVFVANTSIAETSRCNLRNKQKLFNAEFIEHSRQDLPDCLDEIERLKDLVKAAYREGGYGGFHQGFGDYFDEDNNKWDHSKARKALEGTDAGD